MPLLACPNELLLLVAAHLARPRDLCALLRASRRLARLLQPRLRQLALLDKDGVNALLWAALRGHEGLIAAALAAGFAIEMRGAADSRDGKTPLYRAVQSGSLAAVRLLLARGASPRAPTSTAATPLHEAAAYAGADTVALLLAHGARIADADMHRSTALHWAAGGKRAGNLRALLDHSAECIDATDLAGNTALHVVLTLSAHPHSTPADAVARLLLERGASPNAVNDKGRTPLFIAAQFGLLSLMALLLEHGADPHVAGHARNTPLHFAVENGHLQVAALLMDAGASLRYLDRYGHTPLDRVYVSDHRAWSQKWDILEFLLKRTEGIPLRDRAKGRILWWAAENGREAMVRLLLLREIDKFIERPEGETLMQNAVKRRSTMVVKVLQEMETEGLL